jgi:hypothetical protein
MRRWLRENAEEFFTLVAGGLHAGRGKTKGRAPDAK